MSESTPAVGNTLLDLAQLQQLTAPTAKYELHADPESILRSGLVEEVAEYTQESGVDGPVDKDQLEGELGDVLYYVSEISRYKGINVLEITDGLSLDDFQRDRPQLSLGILDSRAQELTLEDHPREVLAVTALRVVDVMNPKHADLWLPGNQRLPLGTALKDLLTATSFIASRYGVTLSQAAQHNIDKLASRPRKPHVIEEANQNTLAGSVRERLNIHPFVGRLLTRRLLAESFE